MAFDSCQKTLGIYPALRYENAMCSIESHFYIYKDICHAQPSSELFSLFAKKSKTRPCAGPGFKQNKLKAINCCAHM